MKKREREIENMLRWYLESVRESSREANRSEMIDGILQNAAIEEVDAGRIKIVVEHEFLREYIELHLLEGMRARFREMTKNDALEVELRTGTVARGGAGTELAADGEARAGQEPPPAPRKADPSRVPPRLHPKYKFESFVVSPSNQFAHAVSLAVAKTPGAAYNPLFIYGGVGLGKTHLLQAIGHRLLAREGGGDVVYVTCEEFLNEMIDALQSGKERMKRFRKRFRTVGCLLIDDIQFIAGKEQTQEEFFNTFNELHNAGRQIVMTSDRPPQDIRRVETRLISRFESGMVADIQPPDYELRLAILRRQAESQNFPAEDGILGYLAKKVTLNIRQLEGALIRLVGHVRVFHKAVTTSLVDEVLGDVAQAPGKRVTVDAILKAVAGHYSLGVDDLVGKRRTKGIVGPRQAAMYLSRTMTGATLEEIGEQFGGKDHSTVLYACSRVEAERKADPGLSADLEEIRRRLESA